ncbi:MAG: hypothetical protein J0M08_07975, partial [Bacteroidetes bacterium]|nr:hypothetical protein [Bacteroidota bacterium]
FVSQTADVKTLAHELAHGAFGLEHPFPQITQGSSGLLMDYASGEELTRMEWDGAHTALPMFIWNDSEEDGSLMSPICVQDSLVKYHVLAPNGWAFKLPTKSSIKKYSTCFQGAIEEFEVNGVNYKADYDGGCNAFNQNASDDFYGYKNSSGTQLSGINYVQAAPSVFAFIKENNTSTNVFKIKNYQAPYNANNKLIDVNSATSYLNSYLSAAKVECKFSASYNSASLTNDPQVNAIKGLFNSLNPNAAVYVLIGNTIVERDSATNQPKYKSISQSKVNQLKQKITNKNFTQPYAVFFEKTTSGFQVIVRYNAATPIKPGYGTPQQVLQQSEQIVEQRLNTYLQNKNDLTKKEGVSSGASLPDGSSISTRNESILEKAIHLVDLGKEFLGDAKIPEKCWDKNNANYSNFFLHTGALPSGIGDGIIEEAKDIPVLVAYGCDLALNPQTRQEVASAFANFTFDTLLNGLTNAGKSWVGTYAQANSQSWHQGGKDAVMVLSMVSGMGAVKQSLDAAASGVSKKMDEVTKVVRKKAVGLKMLGTKIDNFVTVISKDETLPNWIKTSFKDAEYMTVQINQKVTLYRDFGGAAKMDGSFSTTINNATRDELALDVNFNNSMRFKSTIEVPIGVSLNIGKVGPYPPGSPNALPGGADQILLPDNYSHSWIKEVLDTQTGQLYTVAQFKQAFPNLIKNP